MAAAFTRLPARQGKTANHVVKCHRGAGFSLINFVTPFYLITTFPERGPREGDCKHNRETRVAVSFLRQVTRTHGMSKIKILVYRYKLSGAVPKRGDNQVGKIGHRGGKRLVLYGVCCVYKAIQFSERASEAESKVIK